MNHAVPLYLFLPFLICGSFIFIAIKISEKLDMCPFCKHKSLYHDFEEASCCGNQKNGIKSKDQSGIWRVTLRKEICPCNLNYSEASLNAKKYFFKKLKMKPFPTHRKKVNEFDKF